MLVDVLRVIWRVQDVLLCGGVYYHQTSWSLDYNIEHLNQLLTFGPIAECTEGLSKLSSLARLLIQELPRYPHNEADGATESCLLLRLLISL